MVNNKRAKEVKKIALVKGRFFLLLKLAGGRC